MPQLLESSQMVMGKKFSSSLRKLWGTHRAISIVRYAFYAFIFSVPFETVASTVMGIGREGLHVSKLAGYGLVVSALLFQPRMFHKLPPKPFWFFAAYLYIYLLHLIFLEGRTPNEFLVAVQMLILFWISYNIMQDKRVVETSLVILVASILLLSVLQLLGVTAVEIAGGRISGRGMDANHLGGVFALGLLVLVGRGYGQKETNTKRRLLVWAGFGIIGTALVLTGSRGAFVALLCGLFAFPLKGRGSGSIMKTGFSVLLIIGVLSWVAYSYEPIRERWEKTIYEGHTTTRDQILVKAWEMFLDKPLLGWGPEHTAELGSRLGKRSRDTHNLYFYVLTQTGLIGAIPFFAGLWLCCRAAWKARDGTQGTLPLALLVCTLTMNMSVTELQFKLFWVVLAYALASYSRVTLLRLRNPVGLARPTAVCVAQQTRRDALS